MHGWVIESLYSLAQNSLADKDAQFPFDQNYA